jgi:hypothetical protein
MLLSVIGHQEKGWSFWLQLLGDVQCHWLSQKEKFDYHL